MPNNARGLRNNNPGNIRKSTSKWAGLADEQPDPDFCTFKSAQFGIRAMCRILLAYNARGLATVRQIINTWAPPVENNTDAYVNAVAHGCQVSADDVLDVDSAEVMRPLLKEIVLHENGSQPYADSIYDDAMRLAGISDVATKPITQSSAFKASTVTTIGGATAAVTETVRQVQDVNDTVATVHDTAVQSFGLLNMLTAIGPYIALALVVAGLVGLGYSIWKRNSTLGI
jgi:hypothetical protein